MWFRVVFLVLAAFWVAMNALLWCAEFGPRNPVGSAVPVEAVWRKMLTAPDNSSMDIFHHDKKIGFCRWAAVVGEALPAGDEVAGNLSPEGLVTRVTGYRIDFEGNVALDHPSHRLRFDLSAKFSTNHVWQAFDLRLNLRPMTWQFHATAAEQALHLRVEDETGVSERVFRFADLQDPQTVLREFGGPWSVWLLGMAGLSPNGRNLAAPAIGLQWGAHGDWFKIGHTQVRAYRLRARLLDRYDMVIIVSRVGEILRVELPDELVLINEMTAL